MRRSEDQFSKVEKCTIGIASMNTEGAKETIDLTSWLTPQGKTLPDVYIVTFQDLVGLTTGEMFFADTQTVELWK